MAVTQELMGGVISKPAMKEKLLTKPPFRFVHDVVSAVTETTGFAAGLYEGEELDGKGMKDKGAKIAYLEKIIKLVGVVLNTLVDTKSAKIVAGLEPENTNRLLQLLAVAAKNAPDSAEAVKSVLSGDAGETGAPAPKPAAAEAAAPAKEEAAPAAAPAKDDSPPAASMAAAPQTGSKDDDEKFTGGDASSAAAGGDDMGAEPKRSMRPTTARRRPPKVKDNVKQLEQAGVGGTKTEGAAGAAPVGIMVDGDDKDSDDEEEKKGEEDAGFGTTAADGGESKLVKDIMNEAKDAKGEAGDTAEKKDDGKGGIRLGRTKKKASASTKKGGGMSSWSQADIEQLRVAVQQLCKSTNPLGKCMDYVHEDLSSMNKELDRWQAENRRKVDELETERATTEESLAPLKLQLVELDEQLKEQVIKINSMKAKIVKNDQRIEQILQVVVQV
mmetsp:Transcript_26930/g.72256  ORF Transcript_26930/g.72256 Transcript_26930/m.72256 type:complete len:443 (+) Transcript_26930:115-1443(+)